MVFTTLETIKQNAKAYRRRVFRSDGTITVTHDQSVNQVLDDLDLFALSSMELQEVGYTLMHMSRNKDLNAVIENDHVEYWSLVNSQVLYGRHVDPWIREHNPWLVRIDSLLVNTWQKERGSPLQTLDAVNQRHFNGLLLRRYHYPVYHTVFPAVWSGFAYLEGLCRRICSSYVATDGKVKKAFKVAGKQYRSAAGKRSWSAVKRRTGKKSGTQIGDTSISNLRHMLELTRRHVSKDTQTVLTKFFRNYSTTEIFQWRNDSLHGSEDRQTTIIVLYCLISILLLDIIR